MTSTSFNIGLGGSEKSSSRVLRPPGGGHSDIFGVRDNEIENGLVTPSKKRIQHQSSISHCFMQTKAKEPLPVENKEIENGEQEIQNGEQINGIDHEIDENKAPSEPEEEKKAPTPCPQRVRVPPGGFSSGLW